MVQASQPSAYFPLLPKRHTFSHGCRTDQTGSYEYISHRRGMCKKGLTWCPRESSSQTQQDQAICPSCTAKGAHGSWAACRGNGSLTSAAKEGCGEQHLHREGTRGSQSPHTYSKGSLKITHQGKYTKPCTSCDTDWLLSPFWYLKRAGDTNAHHYSPHTEAHLPTDHVQDSPHRRRRRHTSREESCSHHSSGKAPVLEPRLCSTSHRRNNSANEPF